MARQCWEEMKEKDKVGKVKSWWEEKRRKFFKERGMELEEMEKRKEDGDWFGGMVREDREMQRIERWERIGKSEYNKWYKRVKGEGYQNT